MNSTDAYQLDKKGGFYHDFDEKSDCWGVFGTESGFCYSLHVDEVLAEETAKMMMLKRDGSPTRSKPLDPIQEVANELHRLICHLNHIDQCDWQYGKDTYAQKRYREKAKKALQVADKETILKIAKVLR